MMQDKELLIATKVYASENRLLSWWHLLSTIAVQAGFFTLTWMDTPLATLTATAKSNSRTSWFFQETLEMMLVELNPYPSQQGYGY